MRHCRPCSKQGADSGAVARAAASTVTAGAAAAADSAAVPAGGGVEACAPGGCALLSGCAPFDASPAAAAGVAAAEAGAEADAEVAAAPAACEAMAGAELPAWTVAELVPAAGGGRASGCGLPDAGKALPLEAESCCLAAGCLRAVLPPASLKAPAKSWPLLDAA